MKKIYKNFLLAILILPSILSAKTWYVSSTATGGGNGSFANPWQLQTALNQPASVLPGDTIYVRGGIYSGNFTANLNGTVSSPIIIRNYKLERAILSNNVNSLSFTLLIAGSYTWFWGLEITSTSTDRVSSNTAAPATASNSGIAWTTGITTYSTKIINCSVYDNGTNGIQPFSATEGTELYGNLVFNNGYVGTDRGHGHAVYAQNAQFNANAPTKLFQDNIMFNSFGWGFHIYTQGGKVDNFDMIGNVLFNAGANGGANGNFGAIDYHNGNLLVEHNGGDFLAHNINIIRNLNYYSDDNSGDNFFTSDITGGRIDSNYVAGGYVALSIDNGNQTMVGNTAITSSLLNNHFNQSQYPNNIYSQTKPASNYIVTKPNKYDNDRGTIVVYNWSLSTTVSVNPSTFTSLKPGDTYVLHAVQNYYADTVRAVYTGGNITLQMQNHSSPQKALGLNHIATSTFPEYGVFVIEKVVSGLTGINEKYETPSVKIFPNPAQGTLFIETSADLNKYKLVNILGEIIDSGSIVTNKIDFDHTLTGVYFIELFSSDNTLLTIKKIVLE